MRTAGRVRALAGALLVGAGLVAAWLARGLESRGPRGPLDELDPSQIPAPFRPEEPPPGLVAVLRAGPDVLGRVTGVAVSPAGDLIAAGVSSGGGRGWAVGGAPVLREWEPAEGPVNALAFSPDGQTLAGGTAAGNVWLWSVLDGTGGKRPAVEDSTGPVFALAWSPDGRTAAAGREGQVQLCAAGDE